MNTARKRISAALVELPFRMPGWPGDGEEQQARQQLGMKYTGIPFGDPGTPAVTGRIKRILKQGCVMGLQRGF